MIQQIIAFICTLVILLCGICGICSICGSSQQPVLGGRDRPDLTDLQKEVKRDYANLKLPRHKINFAEFCFPAKFRLQNPQKFIAKWMSPGTKNMCLLGFHRIGAGKTCSILQTCELWVDHGRPLVIMPASLIPSFRNEMRGLCTRFEYVTAGEREELAALPPTSARYKEIISASDKIIDSRYTIMSYNKFVNEHRALHPPIIVIDEVHNVNNPSGTYYNLLSKFIASRPKMKLVVFSATPVFDHASELLSLLRLMRRDVTAETLLRPEELSAALDGLVSYYAGPPAHTFPSTTLHYEVCRMSKFQSKWFRAEVEAELKRSGDVNLKEITNNFYAKSRAKSNIVFPRGLSGTDGLPKLSKKIIIENLAAYSCKFARLIRRLRKGQLSFVYTNFASFGGIKSMKKCLQAVGFSDWSSRGPGPRRFAIWTGEQSPREKDAIRNVFNSTANNDASQIQVLIGSPAMREGVSLLRTRQVHVLDPYWNHSRLEQIYGRAVRFCSHKILPAAERTVDIYLYVAIVHGSHITKNNFADRKEILPSESIDGYILKIADRKKHDIEDLMFAVIDRAVDRGLNSTN